MFSVVSRLIYKYSYLFYAVNRSNIREEKGKKRKGKKIKRKRTIKNRGGGPSIHFRNIYILRYIYGDMVILVDQFNLPEDIFKVIFATEQQEVVAKMLMSYMWQNGGEMGKTEMGLFANNLHEGKVIIKEAGKSPLQKEVNMSYNKRQFYDRILTPMRGMGMIDYDLYTKSYKVSDKFNKLMIKIGLMWLRECDKKGK